MHESKHFVVSRNSGIGTRFRECEKKKIHQNIIIPTQATFDLTIFNNYTYLICMRAFGFVNALTYVSNKCGVVRISEKNKIRLLIIWQRVERNRVCVCWALEICFRIAIWYARCYDIWTRSSYFCGCYCRCCDICTCFIINNINVIHLSSCSCVLNERTTRLNKGISDFYHYTPVHTYKIPQPPPSYITFG